VGLSLPEHVESATTQYFFSSALILLAAGLLLDGTTSKKEPNNKLGNALWYTLLFGMFIGCLLIGTVFLLLPE